MISVSMFTNLSDNNHISKNLKLLKTYQGNLRDECNVLNPSIMIADPDIENLVGEINYLYIPVFKRYYYVTGITNIRTGLWRFDCRVDVLQTYKEQILQQTAVISRQENSWNLYLNDEMFKIYQNPIITTQKFPNGFTGESFVLAIAGKRG